MKVSVGESTIEELSAAIREAKKSLIARGDDGKLELTGALRVARYNRVADLLADRARLIVLAGEVGDWAALGPLAREMAHADRLDAVSHRGLGAWSAKHAK